MAVWLVRAGKGGVSAEEAIENNVVGIGWTEIPDLEKVTTKDQLEALFHTEFPFGNPNSAANQIGQIWRFRSEIAQGDLVAVPISSRAAISFGEVVGDYKYRPDLSGNLRHTRKVDWVRSPIPRSSFEQDLLHSLGSSLTVAKISRHNAEERIRAIVYGTEKPSISEPQPNASDEPEDEAQLDLEEFTRDQIQEHIGRRFRGHAFAELIGAILQAQGYATEVSSPGPDSGVDIIAGRGPMGFEQPHLVVQVKSSDTPLGVTTLRELQGVMNSFNAEQGLLVSWGDFRNTVRREALKHYFHVRLWNARDVVDAILRDYDRLSDEIRAELPLKRIWTLVLDE